MTGARNGLRRRVVAIVTASTAISMTAGCAPIGGRAAVEDAVAPTVEGVVELLAADGTECGAADGPDRSTWSEMSFAPSVVYDCQRNDLRFRLVAFSSHAHVTAARTTLRELECGIGGEIAASWLSAGEWIVDLPERTRTGIPSLQLELSDAIGVDRTVVPCTESGHNAVLIEELISADEWDELEFQGDDELKPLDESIADDAQSYEFGEWIEFDNDVALQLSNPRIDPDSAHYLLLDVRMENRSPDDDHGVLSVALVCAGSTDHGFSRYDTTYSGIGSLPPLSYREGFVALTGVASPFIELEPQGVPCEGPARVRVVFGDLFSFDDSYDESVTYDYVVPDDLLEAFNAS